MKKYSYVTGQVSPSSLDRVLNIKSQLLLFSLLGVVSLLCASGKLESMGSLGSGHSELREACFLHEYLSLRRFQKIAAVCWSGRLRALVISFSEYCAVIAVKHNKSARETLPHILICSTPPAVSTE